jgi:hypothetical protein
MDATITLPTQHHRPFNKTRIAVATAAVAVLAGGTALVVALNNDDSTTNAPARTPVAESHAHSQINNSGADLKFYNGRR